MEHENVRCRSVAAHGVRVHRRQIPVAIDDRYSFQFRAGSSSSSIRLESCRIHNVYRQLHQGRHSRHVDLGILMMTVGNQWRHRQQCVALPCVTWYTTELWLKLALHGLLNDSPDRPTCMLLVMHQLYDWSEVAWWSESSDAALHGGVHIAIIL